MANMSARDKIDKEIVDAERQLSEALSRLSRLRHQRETINKDGSLLLDRGLQGLAEYKEPDTPPPMSPEQRLVGEAQSLGAVGIVDWEAMGFVPYGSAGSFDEFLNPEGVSFNGAARSGVVAEPGLVAG
jgi:hypothetical protein